MKLWTHLVIDRDIIYMFVMLSTKKLISIVLKALCVHSALQPRIKEHRRSLKSVEILPAPIRFNFLTALEWTGRIRNYMLARSICIFDRRFIFDIYIVITPIGRNGEN